MCRSMAAAPTPGRTTRALGAFRRQPLRRRRRLRRGPVHRWHLHDDLRDGRRLSLRLGVQRRVSVPRDGRGLRRSRQRLRHAHRRGAARSARLRGDRAVPGGSLHLRGHDLRWPVRGRHDRRAELRRLWCFVRRRAGVCRRGVLPRRAAAAGGPARHRRLLLRLLRATRAQRAAASGAASADHGGPRR